MATSFSTQNRTPKVSFGCPTLDMTFAGGIRCKGITEIVGESGVGKTQLCLQLLLSVQLPVGVGGLAGSSLYLHTENPFPLRRLNQLAENMPFLPENPMDRIFIHHVTCADHLLDVLLRLKSFIIKENIKVIIVDSMAAFFRGVFRNTTEELKIRQGYLYKIASILKSLSQEHGLAVFLTNQVVDVIDNGNGGNTRKVQWFLTSGRKVTAALGLIWGSCVDARFVIRKEDRVVQNSNESDKVIFTRRLLSILFSSYLKNAECEIVIFRNRIAGIPN